MQMRPKKMDNSLILYMELDRQVSRCYSNRYGAGWENRSGLP